MAGVCKIEIRESEVDLKQLLKQAKTGSEKERLQVLYLLKTKKASSVTEAADVAISKKRVEMEITKKPR